MTEVKDIAGIGNPRDYAGDLGLVMLDAWMA
jgi:hypothetical protein